MATDSTVGTSILILLLENKTENIERFAQLKAGHNAKTYISLLEAGIKVMWWKNVYVIRNEDICTAFKLLETRRSVVSSRYFAKMAWMSTIIGADEIYSAIVNVYNCVV